MKKFFKKIGTGLKKLGKGIMKVMSSKIGRVIGMVSLAFGVGSIFKAMFEGVKQTAGPLAADAIAAGAPEVTVEAGKTVAAETAKEVVQETVVAASKDIVGKIPVAETLKETTQLTNELVAGVTKNGTDFSANSITGSANAAVESATKDLTFNAKTKSFELSGEALEATADLNLSPQEILNRSPLEVAEGGVQSATTEQLAYQNSAASSQSLLTPKELDLAQRSQELGTDINEIGNMRPRELKDFLKNSKNRGLYEDLTKLPNSGVDLVSAGNIKGVQEFGSFKEAYQAGDSLLGGVSNVTERALSYDVGELTGGKVTGFLGDQTVRNTALMAGSQLASAPLQPVAPNMYASGVVANLQSQAANTMYSTPSPTLDFTNQISSGVTNPFNAMSSIRQKAGFGNIYGSLNSMASVGS